MKQTYRAESIKVLAGLDAIRKRPGMYIGDTDEYGLHHLLWEMLDNSIDEIMNGFGTEISISLLSNNHIIVEDNGRGIPIGINKKYKKAAIRLIFEKLHSGGKFDSDSYKSSGGLHGVGAAVVNALSSYVKINIYRDNKEYEIIYHNGGKLKTDLKRVGATKKNGTKVEFCPDKNIFKNTIFNSDKIKLNLQERAFLNKNCLFRFHNKKNDDHVEYKYENGIKDYIQKLTKDFETITPAIYFEKEYDDISVKIVFQYTNKYNEIIKSYANNIYTPDGGTHVTGFRSAFTKAINEYAIKNNYIKNKDRFIPSDLREGLVSIVSVMVVESIIQYEGQTKTKLGTAEVRTKVENLVNIRLTEYLNENTNTALKIIEKAKVAQEIRIAAKKNKENLRRKKKVIKNEAILAGKLVKCYSKIPSEGELFLVEGDSAGGSAKMGRNRKFQAILSLKGKILNSLKIQESDLLKNQEINMIISSLECGFDSLFDIDNLRYHKIIIMTDADTDGAHIQALLLTFFWVHMRELILNGNIYLAQPPLFKLTKKHSQNPIDGLYIWDDEKLKKFPNKEQYYIQRYKGLGEMNADQLAYTTMNPDQRRLIRVKEKDFNRANNTFHTLMGNDASKRKVWIAKNVDFSINDFEIVKNNSMEGIDDE